MTRSSLLLIVTLLPAIAGSATSALAADGAALYKTKCAACHGANGSGDTPMGKKLALKPLGSPQVQQQSDAALLETVSKGKGKMPAYGGKVTEADLQALVTHLRSFAKK